jgi:hypothetical protein
MAGVKQHVEVEGRSLSLSNLDKALYPGNGFTKAQVIDYYIRIAPWMLAHYAKRPVPLDRSAGDLLSGRASLTLPRRRSSTKSPLASAGTVEVCANLAECPNATPKSTRRKLALLLPSPSARWQRHIRTLAVTRKTPPEAPGVIQHPYRPRPPQTRAASFKRLYPK